MKALIFDVGGTLVHPDYQLIRTLLAEFGLEPTLSTIKSTEHQAKIAAEQPQAVTPWKHYFGGWFRALGASETDLPELLSRLWQLHREQNVWSDVHPETSAVLAKLLQRGYRLGVVSNSNGEIADLLAAVQLGHYFEVIIDSGVVGVRKPDPAIFERALEEMAVKPAQAIYIGDLYKTDVLGARSAGLRGILYDPAGRHESVDCDKISRLSDLLTMTNRNPQ